jgi:hypothetical protein
MMEGIMEKMTVRMMGGMKMNQDPIICIHVPNLTLVMLGATLAHLSPTLELRIK